VRNRSAESHAKEVFGVQVESDTRSEQDFLEWLHWLDLNPGRDGVVHLTRRDLHVDALA
jgi:hypothetical protein